MEELDPFERQHAEYSVHNTQPACTAEEDIDGTVHTVEMIPHRGGSALLAYSVALTVPPMFLQVIQDKSSRYLGA